MTDIGRVKRYLGRKKILNTKGTKYTTKNRWNALTLVSLVSFMLKMFKVDLSAVNSQDKN